MRIIKKYLKKIIKKFQKKIPIYVPVMEGSLLKNKVAFITGGSRGIGFEIANQFVKQGAYVIISGRNEDTLEKAVQMIHENNLGCKADYLVMDNTKIAEFDSKFKELISKLGGKQIDVLVNNAGYNVHKSFMKVTEEDFDDVINTNLKSVFFLSRYFVNYFIENNIKGNILNISSSSSSRPGITPYTLTKWGVKSFTLGLAKSLIPYGITVNSLASGPTHTPMHVSNEDDALDEYSNPTGRMADPCELANMAVILVSNMGKMCVGDTIYMSGGAGVITMDDVDYNIFY